MEARATPERCNTGSTGAVVPVSGVLRLPRGDFHRQLSRSLQWLQPAAGSEDAGLQDAGSPIVTFWRAMTEEDNSSPYTAPGSTYILYICIYFPFCPIAWEFLRLESV